MSRAKESNSTVFARGVLLAACTEGAYTHMVMPSSSNNTGLDFEDPSLHIQTLRMVGSMS